MSAAAWDNVLSAGWIDPSVLRRGLPPPPSPSDLYASRWTKLIFLEFHDALAAFLLEHRQAQAVPGGFARRASLAVTLRLQGSGKKSAVPAVVGFANCELAERDGITSPGDLVGALLKLEGDGGWVYVIRVDEDCESFPADVMAMLFDDGFGTGGGRSLNRAPCVMFNSFTSFRYRYVALSQFEAVCPHIQAVILAGKRPPSDPEPCIQAVPLGHVSRLNDVQLDVLRRVSGPVDYVHGPPGTGKSTFIVEFLQTRVPAGEKVLLCTTTNKAIDSLASKISACGLGGQLLAVGNEKRLGPTTLRFLLKSRLEADAAVQALAAAKAALIAAEETAANLEELLKQHPRTLWERLIEKVTGRRKSGKEAAAHEKGRQARARVDSHLAALSVALASLRQDHTHPAAVAAALAHLQVPALDVSRDGPSLHELLGALRRSLDAIPIESGVKARILATARFFVCTAATAVKLPDRIARDQGPGEPSAVAELTRMLDAVSLNGSGVREQPDELRFKYVILDEAGAMLEPDVVGTLIHGCQFLLCVGDHLQLPPFTTWRDAGAMQYNVSLLERLAKTSGEAHNMMTVQYRMHPGIALLVSSSFYNGALTTAPSVAAARLRRPSVIFVATAGTEQKVGTSYKNAAEVDAVVSLVRAEKRLLRVGQAGCSGENRINVIAFHRPQVAAIREALERQRLLPDAAIDVVTVDSMQGREADAVILSCARSGRSIGFLADRQRLNVALSRAREVLYIVGNKKALRGSQNSDWARVIQYAQVHDAAR